MAFQRAPANIGCLQGRLGYFNERQNLLTRWFTLEYDQWFGVVLPSIERLKSVVPLGGTSNHIRTQVWRDVGGWDQFNVTEDADLGVRLQRKGYDVGLLDSVTLEEVNSDIVNWVKQRSRWQKGYLQTSVVHLHQPTKAFKELGWSRWCQLMMFMAGTPIMAVANFFFWGMFATWLVTRAQIIEQLFPSVIYYLALGSLVIGNLSMVYVSVITLLQSRRHDHLLWSTLLTPLYWVLISVAAVRAVVQLFIDPFHWEKTQHGIGHAPAPGADATQSAAATS